MFRTTKNPADRAVHKSKTAQQDEAAERKLLRELARRDAEQAREAAVTAALRLGVVPR